MLSRGSTVEDFARAVHKDLARRMSRARIWGDSARFSGQPVIPSFAPGEGWRRKVVSGGGLGADHPGASLGEGQSVPV
ncbi:MAG: TGS domain-containing protein [Bacillota bacterium]